MERAIGLTKLPRKNPVRYRPEAPSVKFNYSRARLVFSCRVCFFFSSFRIMLAAPDPRWPFSSIRMLLCRLISNGQKVGPRTGDVVFVCSYSLTLTRLDLLLNVIEFRHRTLQSVFMTLSSNEDVYLGQTEMNILFPERHCLYIAPQSIQSL